MSFHFAGLQAMSMNFLICNQSLTDLQAAYDSCGCNTTVDPCEYVADPNYNLPLHIAAVFIILVCSLLGASIPLLASRSGFIDAYFVTLGKLVGTGIVLACGLVHMLQPASQSLMSPCVPYEFNTDYQAYAFLYAMLSAIIMQFIEQCANFYVSDRLDADIVDGKSVANNNNDEDPKNNDAHERSSQLIERHLVQSITIEFALTVHSVFIGLAVGTVGYDELVALLTALCFHQFFEGVALGARLADAPLSNWAMVLFIAVFAVSAPTGIACGIVYSQSVNPNGITYLLVEGTFDGLCAGLLLYIGFQLLFLDFPSDAKKFCDGHPRKNYRRAGMFLALWTGAGFMAYIGKYL